MPLIATASVKKDRKPVPAGMQHAVCFAVYDLGTQPANGKFGPKRQVMFNFEIPSERITGEYEGVAFDRAATIWTWPLTNSIGPKARMRPLLISWRGRDFTEQEAQGFDVMTVAGANCLINITHKPGAEGSVYAEISGITPLMKGMSKLAPENDVVKFSLDDTTGPVVIPESIPEWVQDKIKQSNEYLTRAQATPTLPPVKEEEPAEGEDVPF
jgi:hypothetical protein